jgi:hypothetical protein
MSGRILCQLKSDTGELLGTPIDLPLNVDKLGLEKLCQALLSSVNFILFNIIPENLAIEPSGNSSNNLNLYKDTVSGYGNRNFYNNELFSSSKSNFGKKIGHSHSHKPKRKKFERFYNSRERGKPLNYLMHDPGPYRKSLVCST